LMLAPGAVQIYYGDEIARPLTVIGTQGDAHLRSPMNWVELENNTERNGYSIRSVFEHWQKLGQFRKEHPAVGAGQHEMISEKPYVFKRSLDKYGMKDQVIVSLDKMDDPLDVSGIFPDGTKVKDYYSNIIYTVLEGKINISPEQDLYLLGQPFILSQF
jgi:alpha-amylase